MKKFTEKVAKIAAFAALIVTVAVVFAACKKEAKYVVSFDTSGGSEIASVTLPAGSPLSAPNDPTREGYIFDGWYEDLDGERAEIPAVMPNRNVTYYAKWLKAVKINYEYNLDGVPHSGSVESDGVRENGRAQVKDGAEFAAEGYLFLGWSEKADGLLSFAGGAAEGQYFAGDFLEVGSENVTLYAQWAKGYRASAEAKEDIYIYEALIGRGQGAAIRVQEGKENKLGFVSVDPETDRIEFVFMYDEGDVYGILNPDGTYTLRDSTVGSYLYYDYVTRKEVPYVLTTDGYGTAVIMRMVGSQMSTEYFGSYEFDPEFGDYIFTDSADPAVKFYFTLTADSVQEGFAGHYTELGYESGSFLLYSNGELLNYRLDLGGYGTAKWYGYDPISDTTELLSEGIYYGTENYESYLGEWYYAPNSGSGFYFVLNTVESSSGNIAVYVEYDPELAATLTENNGASTLTLDGYGGALYTVSGESYFGYCTVNENRTLITFVPYIDGVAGRTVYFVTDFAAKTYSVNTTDYISDGTRLIEYKGSSPIISVPDTVTVIEADVFNYLTTEVSVISVVIPSSVREIGAKAFQNSYTLQRAVFLSDTPIAIDWSQENDPFRWPSGSFVIVVPEGSQDAYEAAWSDCPYSIKGSEEVTRLPEYEVNDGVLVRYNKQEGSPDTLELTIPDGVTEIAPYVFRGLDFVVKVDLNVVTVIGDGAFENCVNLTGVSFGEVTTVGSAAFAGCYDLASGEAGGVIELPKVVTVGSNAFQSCESLRLVKMGADLRSIGDLAFAECNIYADEPPLYLDLYCDSAPEMGVTVGKGNISFHIKVKNISVALSCFEDPSWNKYCKHLYIESGAEKGLYMDGTDTLELDGRAELMSSYVLLYAIRGAEITFYEYNEENATYTSLSGTIGSDVINFTLGGIEYSFVRVKDEATYVSEDGAYTLTCNPRIFNPAEYEGAHYETVTFCGVETTIFISGYNVKRISNFLDTDGKRYDFNISIVGNTLLYEKKPAEAYVRNITATDGSVLNLHFVGNTVYVFGSLKIEVSDGTYLPEWSDWGVTAQSVSGGTYTFVRPYQSDKYEITVTVSADNATFTYSYRKVG